MYHYTPAERQDVLEILLVILRDDPRTDGILLVGSGSEGFDDEYSDIDMHVVIHPAEHVRSAFLEFEATVRGALAVSRSVESVRGANVFLWAMLLENYLEIDVCFLALADLTARKGRWKVMYDQTDGKIEDIQRKTWAEKERSDPTPVDRDTVGAMWHHIIHATIAVQRGQHWRALWEIEEIRDHTIELRGLAEGLETKRYRHVDQMSQDFLFGLERARPARLEGLDLMDSVKRMTGCFF
jgi:predicted nucleotidyltransferase